MSIIVARPKDLPNRLECSYCKRLCTHGGACSGKSRSDETGCLYFLMDERGYLKREDLRLPYPLYSEIPPINTWINDQWTLYGQDTSIKMIKIKGLTWDSQGGYLIVWADCEFFINDLCKEYKEALSKPKFKVLKGGKE